MRVRHKKRKLHYIKPKITVKKIKLSRYYSRHNFGLFGTDEIILLAGSCSFNSA